MSKSLIDLINKLESPPAGYTHLFPQDSYVAIEAIIAARPELTELLVEYDELQRPNDTAWLHSPRGGQTERDALLAEAAQLGHWADLVDRLVALLRKEN
jgi:hypothetical protein